MQKILDFFFYLFVRLNVKYEPWPTGFVRFMLSNCFFSVFLFDKLKLSTYDKRPLTAEEQSRSVRLAVTQHEFSPWSWMWNEKEILGPRMMNSTTESSFAPIFDIPVQNIELPVAADGVMSFQVQLSDSVATLDIEVRTLHPHFPWPWYVICIVEVCKLWCSLKPFLLMLVSGPVWRHSPASAGLQQLFFTQ